MGEDAPFPAELAVKSDLRLLGRETISHPSSSLLDVKCVCKSFSLGESALASGVVVSFVLVTVAFPFPFLSVCVEVVGTAEASTCSI